MLRFFSQIIFFCFALLKYSFEEKIENDGINKMCVELSIISLNWAIFLKCLNYLLRIFRNVKILSVSNENNQRFKSYKIFLTQLMTLCIWVQTLRWHDDLWTRRFWVNIIYNFELIYVCIYKWENEIRGNLTNFYTFKCEILTYWWWNGSKYSYKWSWIIRMNVHLSRKWIRLELYYITY